MATYGRRRFVRIVLRRSGGDYPLTEPHAQFFPLDSLDSPSVYLTERALRAAIRHHEAPEVDDAEERRALDALVAAREKAVDTHSPHHTKKGTPPCL